MGGAEWWDMIARGRCHREEEESEEEEEEEEVVVVVVVAEVRSRTSRR